MIVEMRSAFQNGSVLIARRALPVESTLSMSPVTCSQDFASNPL